MSIAFSSNGAVEGGRRRLSRSLAGKNPCGVLLERAATQLNLALAYRAFFDNDHQPRRLDDALEAVDGALEEFRKAKSAFYIEKAEHLRGEILAAEGNRTLPCPPATK